MELKLDDTLKSLIDLGKRSGYLTWDQVNAQIPPDTVEPERLDQILELLDQNGISIIEEDQAEDRAARTTAENETDEALRDVEHAFADDGDGKHTDDPVRMYLTRWVKSPSATAARKSRSPRRLK
jgi:RNA polymerase primary sigma factor